MCVSTECSGTISSNAMGRGGLGRPCHCCCGFALTEGKLVHEQIIQSSYDSNFFVGRSLLSMYSKRGSMEDAT
jgi:hypothetical protein